MNSYEMQESDVTKEFRVDQYDNVFNENWDLYSNWTELSKHEQEIVKQNQFSAR